MRCWQVEYLWPPCTYLEPNGPSYLVGGAGVLLTMHPVRINVNGKVLTVKVLPKGNEPEKAAAAQPERWGQVYWSVG
jgi:hypothetical protein